MRQKNNDQREQDKHTFEYLAAYNAHMKAQINNGLQEATKISNVQEEAEKKASELATDNADDDKAAKKASELATDHADDVQEEMAGMLADLQMQNEDLKALNTQAKPEKKKKTEPKKKTDKEIEAASIESCKKCFNSKDEDEKKFNPKKPEHKGMGVCRKKAVAETSCDPLGKEACCGHDGAECVKGGKNVLATTVADCGAFGHFAGLVSVLVVGFAIAV